MEHDHNHSHSHSHKKRAFNYSPKMSKHVFYFTFFHLFLCMPFTYFVSLHYPRTRPEDYPKHYYAFHMTLMSIMWTLCMSNLALSRFRSSGKAIESSKEEDTNCSKCKIKRSDRAHHCSTCQKCTLRMDHHCVWVSNCIGLNNHKNFFWYSFYTVFGGSYYLYLCSLYFFSGHDSVYDNTFVKGFYLYYFFVVLLFSYFTSALLNIQLRCIIKNNTNLEYMKEMGSGPDFLRYRVYSMVRVT
jgi:DHHC palmitoyltransferase